jgi:hypothetical protein
MNDAQIRWYSINRKLAVEEHEFIRLDEAWKIADSYLARAGERFEWFEEA